MFLQSTFREVQLLQGIEKSGSYCLSAICILIQVIQRIEQGDESQLFQNLPSPL